MYKQYCTYTRIFWSGTWTVLRTSTPCCETYSSPAHHEVLEPLNLLECYAPNRKEILEFQDSEQATQNGIKFEINAVTECENTGEVRVRTRRADGRVESMRVCCCFYLANMVSYERQLLAHPPSSFLSSSGSRVGQYFSPSKIPEVVEQVSGPGGSWSGQFGRKPVSGSRTARYR